MGVNKCKLTGVMFAVLMASSVCSYANGGNQGDTLSDSSLNLLLENAWNCQELVEKIENRQEIVEKIKSCIAADSIHIIASKNIKVITAWACTEAKDESRYVAVRLSKETGICTAVSLPKTTCSEVDSKKKKKRKTNRFCEELSILRQKAEVCLAAENVRIIETKNYEILQTWLEAETQDKRSFCVNFDKETGMRTAVSNPKIKDVE